MEYCISKNKTPTHIPASPAQKQFWPTPGLAECAAHLSCMKRKSSKNQVKRSETDVNGQSRLTSPAAE